MLLAVLLLESAIMPLCMCTGRYGGMLEADLGHPGRAIADREMIPQEEIPADEIGQIMKLPQ